MDRRLILLRHGQTQYNASRRMQGQLDTRLDDTGRRQALAAATWLARMGVVKIVSSDLSRAADTAGIIGDELGLEATTDKRLRETHLGEWQGCTHEEVDQGYPGARARWRNDATWAPPGGESRIAVARRARPAVDQLVDGFADWGGSAVLMVAHSGVISALTSNLLGLGVEQYPLITGLTNAAASVLSDRPRVDETSATNQWYLRGWNLGGEV